MIKVEYLSWDAMRECMEPIVYVEELEKEISIVADLPAVEKKDIKVNATENSVEISAKFKKPFTFEKWGISQKGVCFSSLKKGITFNTKIDPDNGKARFKKGVLRLTFPKVKEWREIKID